MSVQAIQRRINAAADRRGAVGGRFLTAFEDAMVRVVAEREGLTEGEVQNVIHRAFVLAATDSRTPDELIEALAELRGCTVEETEALCQKTKVEAHALLNGETA